MPERFIDEPVNFRVGDKEVSLLFRHLGISSSNQEQKIGVDSDVVAELFDRLELLNSNPSLADNEIRTVIDYRSFFQKLKDPAPEVFPEIQIAKKKIIFGTSHTNVPDPIEGNKRYIYINKTPSIQYAFDSHGWMEKVFRHESQHLSVTKESFEQAGELYWNIADSVSFIVACVTPALIVREIREVRPVESQDYLVAFGAQLAILLSSYYLHTRFSIVEQDAIKAEKVLREKTVFQWPDKKDNKDITK